MKDRKSEREGERQKNDKLKINLDDEYDCIRTLYYYCCTQPEALPNTELKPHHGKTLQDSCDWKSFGITKLCHIN